jgi:hypothetical protein
MGLRRPMKCFKLGALQCDGIKRTSNDPPERSFTPMATIQPQGENMRKAIQWISAERQDNPKTPLGKLIDQACLSYNLTPAEAAYLDQWLKQSGENQGA